MKEMTYSVDILTSDVSCSPEGVGASINEVHQSVRSFSLYPECQIYLRVTTLPVTVEFSPLGKTSLALKCFPQ